jgi:hypothetical protein
LYDGAGEAQRSAARQMGSVVTVVLQYLV